MELYDTSKSDDDIIAISESFGVAAQVIGRVESSPKKRLTIESKYGTFDYH